jgi:hypothetical protein
MILGMIGRWPRHIYDFIIGTLFGRDSRRLPRRLTPEVNILAVVVNARQHMVYCAPQHAVIRDGTPVKGLRAACKCAYSFQGEVDRWGNGLG